MNDNIVIVIPSYKETLSEYEIMAVDNCIKKISDSIDIEFIFPAHKLKNTQFYDERWSGRTKYKYYDKWDGSLETYNQMCISKDFYEMYSDYDYMLIHQTDVVITGTEEELREFTKLGYDYYGAPLTAINPNGIPVSRKSMPERGIDFAKKKLGLMKPLIIGNGGCSLRKVDSLISLCEKYKDKIIRWFPNTYEDIILSWLIQYDKEYHACPVEVGKRFAFDCVYREDLLDSVFAVHGRFVIDSVFWEKYTEKGLMC